MLSAIRRRFQHATESGDDGITLMELIVSMGLMTVLGAMATVFFVGMYTSDNRTVGMTVSTANARNVLTVWADTLSLADSSTSAGSGANRFVQITPTTAIFYANIANRATTGSVRTAPTEVELSLESGQLIERLYQCSSGCTAIPPAQTLTPTYPSSPSSIHYYGSGASTQGAWLFSPYIVSSTSATPVLTEPDDCAGGTAGLCTGYTGADAVLKTVVRVDIAFTVTTLSGDAENFSSSATITGSTSS